MVMTSKIEVNTSITIIIITSANDRDNNNPLQFRSIKSLIMNKLIEIVKKIFLVHNLLNYNVLSKKPVHNTI